MSLSSSRLIVSVPVVPRITDVRLMLPSEFTVRSTSLFVAVTAASVTVLASPVASTTVAVVSAPLSRIEVTFVPTFRSPVERRSTPAARSTRVATSLIESVVAVVTSPSRSTIVKSLIARPAVSVVIVPEKVAVSSLSSPPSIVIEPASSCPAVSAAEAVSPSESTLTFSTPLFPRSAVESVTLNSDPTVSVASAAVAVTGPTLAVLASPFA